MNVVLDAEISSNIEQRSALERQETGIIHNRKLFIKPYIGIYLFSVVPTRQKRTNEHLEANDEITFGYIFIIINKHKYFLIFLIDYQFRKCQEHLKMIMDSLN
jgi:hypothetical protein